MNRKQRRIAKKLGEVVPKTEPTRNMRVSDIQKIKQDAVDEAVNEAFFLMLAIPVYVLHDKIGDLMKREVNGVGRLERFARYCLDTYDAFQKDYITLDDLRDTLWQEANIKLERD